MSATTLAELLAPIPDAAPALGAPGRGWMDFAMLRAQAVAVQKALAGAEIGRGDRVAIVLPNGP
jgi:acyl-CoA synthetase (AMP-forming)/AMP-acid ligase II